MPLDEAGKVDWAPCLTDDRRVDRFDHAAKDQGGRGSDSMVLAAQSVYSTGTDNMAIALVSTKGRCGSSVLSRAPNVARCLRPRPEQVTRQHKRFASCMLAD
jgi:hypothetical protein